MARITVTSINNNDPSPILRQNWRAAWLQALAGAPNPPGVPNAPPIISAWVVNGAGWQCNTALSRAQITQIVTQDLNAWMNADPNRRNFDIQ